MTKRLLALLLVFSAGLSSFAMAQAPIPELVPGWTMRQATNSTYFTRPDVPNIQVGLVNDLRPNLTADEKFESAKAFFAERTNTPGLATAETDDSFGMYKAFDDPENPRCYLTAMGHWREGGLQIVLVLNETPERGPKPGDDVFEAILQDFVQYCMLRYEIGDKEDVDLEQGVPVEFYAKSIDSDHKPKRILKFENAIDVYSSAFTALEIMNRKPGDPLPRRDQWFTYMLLFEDSAKKNRKLGTLCADWDPGFFSPDAILAYHAKNDCFRFDWRWKDGVVDGDVEVKPIGKDWMPATTYLQAERFGKYSETTKYNRIKRGSRIDLSLGLVEDTLRGVAAGELPVKYLAANDAVLTADGRIMLGHLATATLPDLDPGVATYRPVRGEYFLDGHVIIIKLEDGHVVRGFLGWLPGEGETEIGEASTLMINGVHYFN